MKKWFVKTKLDTLAPPTEKFCFQVNQVLNVGDLATQTLTQGAATTDAGLTSTQTTITAIVNKINEILQKSTLSC